MKWENNVRKVVPYVPGEQPRNKKVIKLNTNENPYPPSPLVKEALEHISYETLRRYPDTKSTELVDELARVYQVDKENVFVGIGSDDVLALCFLTFFNSGKPVIFPDITYSFYDVWADLYRIPYECKPLDDRLQIKKSDYFCENGGIILPNPNAPTGAEENINDLEEIIKKNSDVVVIIDEAYVDFGAKSVLPLIDKYDNLMVIQTFSKSRSLAGIRIGYAIGNKKLIQYLNDVKFSFNSYTMNPVTIAVGAASLRDSDYFKYTSQQVIKTRERVKKELSLLGFSFPDSKTNFIFATHDTVLAKEIFKAAKEEGIFVRYFNKPRIDNYLRISIGTDEEMDTLISFLQHFLKR